jgi:hypothetical protein
MEGDEMSEVPLRDYIERRLDDLDRRYEQRFADGLAAITKAEQAINDRLAGMNEFRDALKDQASRMATRAELEAVGELVSELRRAKAHLDGRLVMLATVVSAAVSLLMWAVSVWGR